MHCRAAAIALTLAVLTGAAFAKAPERIVLPTDVVPSHYDLAIVPDAAHMRFTGTVAIALDVKAPTRTIALNAADLTFGKVTLSGVAEAPRVTFDATKETATLSFAKPMSAGPHVLTIAYAGKINLHAAGLFALDYDGGKKRALYTQFENSDARRFMPCWDEPGVKATFTLTATVPDGQMAVSNMPIARTTPAGQGTTTVAFAPSPRMSSYLLFFALGDFQRIHRNVGGIDVGVVTTAGKAAQGAYALEAEAHLLPYYERYFGVKYPLPKLDLIAAPGGSQFFGAMENWGAIFFFERDLLIDPKISTEGDKRGVYIVVAHETAHQWFGDLVTMAWWDDLWLNEGFAQWMESKATGRFQPEWKLGFYALGQKEGALIVDSREGTHPIIQPIADVLQANEAFDTITYDKGQAVIAMLQEYVGPEPFRQGVAAYIKAHAYGPAVTDALWQSLERSSPVPVAEIAHDFTLQAGVPLITVRRTANGIRLSQTRFVADASGRLPAQWHVPVIAKPLGATAAWRGIVGAAPVDIALAPDAVPVVNAGQSGYFRTLYAPDLFRRMAAHFAGLDGIDQLGLVNDVRTLGYAGYQPLSDFLDLAGRATPDTDPAVLTGIVSNIGQLADLYRGLPGEAAFDRYGQRLLRPLFVRLGWEARPGESQNVTLLRSTLLDALNTLNDPATIAEADRRFAAYLKTPSSLTGDLRLSVLKIAATHATPQIWAQFHTLARGATSSLERRQLYTTLALAEDPRLAQAMLDLTLTGEVEVTTRPTIIESVAGYRPELAVAFTIKHLDQVYAWIEPDGRAIFVPALAGNSYDRATIGVLKAFAAQHIPASARQDAVKAEAKIAYYTGIRETRLAAVDRWLALRTR
jgi:aminopeptidase N